MNADYELIRIGVEDEPVIVIDEFSSQFEGLLIAAESAEFLPVTTGYPGVRTAISPDYLGERRALLSSLLSEIFGYSHGASIEGSDLSMVTTSPSDLKQTQRIPHYDGTDENLLALLHYVNCPDDGGTAFYRHRATGFETITPERKRTYARILGNEMKQFGPFPDRYFDRGDSLFEKIGEVKAIPNRMVIYRGWSLHSGCIRPDADLSSDPRKGRLTINVFLNNIY